jgi:hypothetical protein
LRNVGFEKHTRARLLGSKLRVSALEAAPVSLSIAFARRIAAGADAGGVAA